MGFCTVLHGGAFVPTISATFGNNNNIYGNKSSDSDTHHDNYNASDNDHDSNDNNDIVTT